MARQKQQPSQTNNKSQKSQSRRDLPPRHDDWDLRTVLEEKIRANGGWVNAHCHLDRAYTITQETLPLADASLQEKWSLVDHIKRQSTVSQIYDRMAFALEHQRRQGVKVIGSFIDVDEIIGEKAMTAAQKLRENNTDCHLVFINQTLKGVLEPEAQRWFLRGAEFVDIIGGLPGRDRWFEDEHLDIILATAKRMGKKVHVHVDQFNTQTENEVELLADKVIEHGMQGRTVAIHGISLAAKSVVDRRRIYKKMREAELALIACPTAWIDSRRTEELSVTHNAIAPVEELLAAGITVGIGTDNIADVYKPFNDGEMWTELRFLLESCHYYSINKLLAVATNNGRHILGVV